jgi:hypothetical protein
LILEKDKINLKKLLLENLEQKKMVDPPPDSERIPIYAKAVFDFPKSNYKKKSSIKAFYSSIPGFLKQTKPIGDG